MIARRRFTRVSVVVFAVLAWLISSAPAAPKMDARAWRAVKTYDMVALQKIEPLPLRQKIGVRFNYRARDIRHLKPNWFYCSVWSVSGADGQGSVNSVPVMVAKADVPAFTKLPANRESAGKYIAYGEILKDAESNLIFLRVIRTTGQGEVGGGDSELVGDTPACFAASRRT